MSHRKTSEGGRNFTPVTDRRRLHCHMLFLFSQIEKCAALASTTITHKTFPGSRKKNPRGHVFLSSKRSGPTRRADRELRWRGYPPMVKCTMAILSSFVGRPCKRHQKNKVVESRPGYARKILLDPPSVAGLPVGRTES